MLLTCHDIPIEDAPSYAPTYMIKATGVSQMPHPCSMVYKHTQGPSYAQRTIECPR
jgi:hypothetical protein